MINHVRPVVCSALLLLPAVPLWAKSPAAGRPSKKPAATAQALTPLQKCMNDLKSPDAGLRRMAAEELSRLRDPHATPALVVALSDEDAGVRASAARALGLMRAQDAAKELGRLLAEDPDSQVRQSAAVALGFLGDPASAEGLAKALKDKDPGTRFSACQALSSVRSPLAVPALIEALNADPSPSFRKAAAHALGEAGDPAAAPALRPLLKDKDVSVQVAGVQALGKLKDEASASAFKKFLKEKSPAELRVAAAHALARQGSKAGRDAALQVLENKAADGGARVAAVQALGDMADKPLASPLREIEKQEPEGYVKTAIKSLLDRVEALP